MIKVFVSGCYDIIHAGHVQFFRDAKALGDHLTVCFASDDTLWAHKQRRSSLPQEHKHGLIAALEMVDDVVMGNHPEIGLDFQDAFRRARPDILAVTADDRYEAQKRQGGLFLQIFRRANASVDRFDHEGHSATQCEPQ